MGESKEKDSIETKIFHVLNQKKIYKMSLWKDYFTLFKSCSNVSEKEFLKKPNFCSFVKLSSIDHLEVSKQSTWILLGIHFEQSKDCVVHII